MRGTSIAAGLGETTLRNYLKGMTASLTVDTIEKIAAVLEVPAQWLLFGDEPKQDAEIIGIWDRIPADRRSEARDILEVMAKGSAKR